MEQSIYTSKTKAKEKEGRIKMTTVPSEKQNKNGLTDDQQKGVEALGEALSFFIKPLLLKWLWNWVIPGVFGLATITYLQALALYFIAKILFDHAKVKVD